MSSRNPNSGTFGYSSPSPSPSPSPNSGENRENIAPQREEIQTDETVPKEEQSAVTTADSTSKEEEVPKQENPGEKILNQENPVEEIPKPENPDEKIPEEEDREEEMPQEDDLDEEDPEEIPKRENPDEEMPQEEDPAEEILEQENPEPEIPQQANPHEEIPLEGDKLLAYLSGIVPEQQQMFADIQVQNQQEAQVANQEQVLEALPLSYAFVSDNLEDYGFFSEDDESLKHENATLDAMYSANRANEPNRGSGNNLEDYGFFSEDNESLKHENAILDAMYAANRANEPNRGSGNRGQENPTIDSIHSIPTFEPNRIGSGELYNPTIDATFNYRSAINPNRGFTIRDPQNPTNNPAPAAVPEQQDKGKGKDESTRPTKNRKYCPEYFLFPGSTSEEDDDIITMKFVSAYSRNQWPLPSAGSPEHFDTLFAFISSQLPRGESISLETLKEKFAKLVKKYVRLLRQRDISLNFEALATNYDRELYQLGRETWGFACAEGYRFPPGIVGTSGTNGDSS